MMNKLAENDVLRESEERLRLAFWAANIGFWTWDLLTQEVYLSPIWKSQLGYEDHELANALNTWESLLHPQDRASSWQIIREAQNDPQRVFELFFRLRHKDLKYRWIMSRGRVYRDTNGKPIRIMGCHIDVTQQKEDERRVRHSETQLHLVLDSGRMGMWIWDMRTNQVIWNEREYELLDLDSSQLSPSIKDFYQSLHPDDRAPVEEAVRLSLSEDRDYHAEFRVIRSDGKIRWLKGAGRAIHDPQTSAPTQMVGVNYDITAFKEAIAGVVEAHEFNRQIIANAQEGIIVYDRELKFRMWNPHMELLSGVRESEVIGKSLLEAFPLLKGHGVEECLEKALRGELVTGNDLYYVSPVTKKEGWTTSQYGPWRDAHGDIIGVIATVRDITERKLTEQKFFDNQQRMELILQQLPSILWTTDKSLQFTSMSGSGLRNISSQPSTAVGQTVQQVLHLQQDHPTVEAHRQALQGRSISYDHDFEGRCFHAHLEPLRTQNGDILGCIGVAIDVTERIKQEQEQQALQRRVQHAQKLESLEVLAGGIAHDFNNLLTGMLGYANLALLEVPVESPAAAMIREIEKAAQRAADLSRQMLAYSGKGKFVIEVIRLDQLVVEMASLLKTTVSPKAQLHIVADPVIVEGDATQIRQVVMNLITNAADAIQKEGYIAIRTGVRQFAASEFQQAILQTALPEGEYAYLEVQDNGLGMSPEMARKIFDPFFTTKFTGRGLGLASVLGIVRGHRSSIFVESRLGVGTTFRVVLPVSKSQPTDPSNTYPKLVMKPESGKILVIEDDDGVLHFVRHVLDASGYQTLTTTDSKQALELLSRHGSEIRAALIDLTMPSINGIDLAKMLRKSLPELPILLMSGYSEEEVTQKLAGLHVNGFLHKPFRAQEMTTLLTRIISEPRAQA